MIYVALLRGINVGGKSKVEMSKLKLAFESSGCRDVLIYINSGNVIFRDTRADHMLLPLIESILLKNFGFKIQVLLRDLANICKLCKEIPIIWTNDTQQKTDVLFLRDEINSPDIKNKIVINPKLEHVMYINGALVWNIKRKNVTKGNGVKLMKTELYKHMTIRNINTVRKLHLLMQNLNDSAA